MDQFKGLLQKIGLKTDLVCFDLETTELDTSLAKIVEISLTKLMLNGEIRKMYHLINPGKNLTEGVVAIHGIDNTMVADKPYFISVAKEVFDFIGDAAICGFNSNHYDLPIIIREFSEAGIEFDYINRVKIDVKNLHQRFYKNSLSELYKFYTGNPITNAHQAEFDVIATLTILDEQVKRFGDQWPSDLDTFCNYDRKMLDFSNKFYLKDGVVYYNFGVNKGIPCLDDKSYLNWVVYKSGMSPDVRLIGKQLLDGRKF